MTRTEFVSRHSIEQVFKDHRITLKGDGNERKAVCPFHSDTNPSLMVNVHENTWFCHGGCGGGGVIDFMARMEKITPVEFLKKHQIDSDNFHPSVAPAAPARLVMEKCYDYRDALGNVRFQVVRCKPKTFRQRHLDSKGAWVWGMEGIDRLLYRLPEVLKSQMVWIVEGEKDADNLSALGMCATCNVGGAGKWLDGYTESLAGKDIIICGDNDDAGRKHVELVFDSIAGKVKTARLVRVPAPHKDVSDFIEAEGKDKANSELNRLVMESTIFVKGIKLPIFTMVELESKYRDHATRLDQCTLNLARWLPSLKDNVRGLVPGEVILILGDTGTGKTALLQSIALHAKPLPTLMFEMELPDTLLYERFVAAERNMTCRDVESAYRTCQDSLGSFSLTASFPHLFMCTQPKLSVDEMESIILRSELKIGKKPLVVIIDYVQLLGGIGNRYEKTSDAAEAIKRLAKSTGTICVVASQVHRNEYGGPEITLHSGKDSGALENSAGLVLGAWRDSEDKKLLYVRVLKNTKGISGQTIPCNFNGETMRVTERSKIADSDVPMVNVWCNHANQDK